MLDWVLGTNKFAYQYTVPFPSAWPKSPSEYTGPRYIATVDSDSQNYIQTIETFGLGLLTADILTVAGGGKSFGALGQGNLKTNAGVDIPNTVTTYGSKIRKENSTACDASY